MTFGGLILILILIALFTDIKLGGLILLGVILWLIFGKN